jgi:hypothetical protein
MVYRTLRLRTTSILSQIKRTPLILTQGSYSLLRTYSTKAASRIMEWPIQDDRQKPVTTPTNQAIWAAALEAAMAERPEAVAAWKERLVQCNTSTKWRNEYMHLVEDFVRIQAQQCSSDTILKMCNAGLDAANQTFVFRPPGSDATVSVQQAFSVEPNTWEGPPFETTTYTGQQEIPKDQATPFRLASPYGTDSSPIWLKGGYLVDEDDNSNQSDYIAAAGQLDAWVEFGCMEPSAAEHARNVMALSDIVPLVQDKTFVLLGLTSEMGPALHLLKIPHAHILGVARDSGNKIPALVQHLQQHGTTTTKLQIPCSKSNNNDSKVVLGADLLTQGPQIARWIAATAPQDRSIVLLPLAYMDGEANVRVTVAMDNIVTLVQKLRGPTTGGDTDISLAYLTSPATVYTIPPAAALDAKQRYEQTSLVAWPTLFSALSFRQWLNPVNTWKQLTPNSDSSSGSNSSSSHDHDIVLLNGLVNLQGPNYALAKTMQQWRCMSAAALGYTVSAPHAPPTRTYSVQHNVYAAAGLEGLVHVCPPTVAFDVQPCSSLMTAILLDQLSISKKQQQQHHHPMELFWDGSVHGGCWRSPYSQDNAAKAAFLVGLTVGKIAAKYPPQAMGPRPRGSS